MHPGLQIQVLFFCLTEIVVKTEESGDIQSRITHCTRVRDAFRGAQLL